jgi:hypothetical protein
MTDQNVIDLDAGAVPAEPEAPASAIVLPGISYTDKRLWTKGIRKRRSAAIIGYVGLNGRGKTAAMIRDTLPSLAIGRRVLSTVVLLDPHTGNPHPLYEPFTSWQQLHDLHDTDVLLDEITGIMDSRESGMPKHVRRLLPQQRRQNNLVRWTGINWDNSDRRMRQLTQVAAVCNAYLPVPEGKLVREGQVKDAIPLWRPNRVFSVIAYDASTMSQSDESAMLTQDEGKKKKARVLNREWWWGPGSLTFDSYRTLDSVTAIDNGCPICGGRIPDAPICKGHPETGPRALSPKWHSA